MDRKPRIIFNDDSDSLRLVPPPHTPAKTYVSVDYLKKTQVDMLCWCVAGQSAYSYPSRVVENVFDAISRIAGEDDNPYFPHRKDLMLALHRKGIDYLPLLIRRAHGHRKSFVASFRMNDTHHKSTPNGILAPEFWKQRQHHRLWEVTDGKSYLNAALDYSFPDVRQQYASMIREVAENYDIDGVELDFSRTPYLFQPSEAWKKRQLLTRFILELRAMLKRIEAKKGKRILLLIRTLMSKQELIRFGMDLETWIDSKMMDIVVLTNLVNNYNASVEPWLGMCHRKGILLYPAVEAGPALFDKDHKSILPNNPLAPAHNYVVPRNDMNDQLKQLRGMAQNYLSQGVDGIYLFNYRCIIQEESKCRADTAAKFRKMISILYQMGSQPALRKTDKEYLFWTDPLYAESGRPPQYHQTLYFNILDPVLRDKRTKVVIRFRQIATKNPHAFGQYRQNPYVPKNWMKVLLNGKEIDGKRIQRTRQPKGRILCGFVLDRHELVSIRVASHELKMGENRLAFHIPKYPHERDPYIYIYQLEVDVIPQR